MKNWPRLSQTLTGPRDLTCCQKCGAVADLAVWQECDEEDRPEAVYVVLCDPCAEKIIEPHPRLYRRTDALRGEPLPGVMPTCLTCGFREGVSCRSPDLKANGGQGLRLSIPKPTVVHVLCSPRRNSGWKKIWNGPVECAGKRPKIHADAPPGFLFGPQEARWPG